MQHPVLQTEQSHPRPGLRLRLLHTLRRTCAGMLWLDHFTRTTYFGFTTLLVLLGAGSVGGQLDASLIGGLVAVAACFHVYSYVSNDVIDLAVDATQPRRSQDPLVKGLRGEPGGISTRAALTISLLPIVPAALISYGLGAGREAWLALTAGFALIGVYNLWGKRCPVPPLTDLAQALGWAGLALYGVWLAHPSAGLDDILGRTLPLLALSAGFIVIISGIHGGLRDLVNDQSHDRRTTALFFAARPADGAGQRAVPAHAAMAVHSSTRLAVYTAAVLVGMFWPAIRFLAPGQGHYADAIGHSIAATATAALLVANVYLGWRVVKPVEPDRDPWISRQGVVLLLPPLALYLPSALPSTSIKWLVVLLFVVPLLLQARIMGRVLVYLDRIANTSPRDDVGSSRAADSGRGARR